MVKPGNTAKQGACSEPGPGEASGSIQLTLEEQEKDASDEVEEQLGSEVTVWDLERVDSSPSLGCVI